MLLTVLALAQSAFAFDHTHAAFEKFLGGAVTTAGVDYTDLQTRKDVLDGYLSEVANANADGFSKEQQLAFYVNAYNAYTLNLILTEKPGSILDLDGGKVWQTRKMGVARKSMTLNDLEHGTIRKLEDGRVHAVVNCASKGCPPLPAKPLQPENLQGQLDAAAKHWVSVNAYKVDGSVAQVSKIFNWYAEDFTGMAKDQATDDEKFKAAAKFITKYGGDLTPVKSYEWADYSWKLNAK